MSSWFRDKIRRIVIWQERRWHVWPVLYDSQRDRHGTCKEGEIRYLAGRAEWKKTCRKVHCTPLYTKKNQVDTPVIGAWCMKDGSLVIKVYEIEMLEEDTLTLTPEVDGTQVKLVNTTIPSQPNEYISTEIR